MSVVAIKVEGDLYHLACVPHSVSKENQEEVTADAQDNCVNCGTPLGETDDDNEDENENEDEKDEDD